MPEFADENKTDINNYSLYGSWFLKLQVQWTSNNWTDTPFRNERWERITSFHPHTWNWASPLQQFNKRWPTNSEGGRQQLLKWYQTDRGRNLAQEHLGIEAQPSPFSFLYIITLGSLIWMWKTDTKHPILKNAISLRSFYCFFLSLKRDY